MRVGRLRDRPSQHVLAVRVHPVQEENEKRDQEEIAVLSQQPEGAAPADALLLSPRPRRRVPQSALPFPGVHDPGQREAHEKERSCRQEHRVHAERGDQLSRGPGADRGSSRSAERHERQEALSLFRRVHVVRERPELRDDHHAEDADPDEEGHADRDTRPREEVEGDEARHEEQRHGRDETAPVHTPREHPVERNEEDQQQRLTRRGIARGLGASAPGDQRLADRLQHVIRRQDEEHVEREQERGRALAGPDLREETQQALERILLARQLGGLGSASEVRKDDRGARRVRGTRHQRSTAITAPEARET